MADLTPEHLNILQHALGLDQYGQGDSYRNHYVAGGDDVTTCRELVAMGWMREVGSSELTGGSPGFVVPQVNVEAVRRLSPAPPKLTPGQKRYRRWLDMDSGQSFGQFLRNFCR